MEKYTSSLEKALKLGKQSGVAKGVGIGVTYGIVICALALYLWYSSILVINGEITGGNACITIANTIFGGFALGQAVPCVGGIAKGCAAVANITEQINNKHKDENDGETSLFSAGLTLPNVNGEIEFQEVSFSYPSRQKLLLDRLSFRVPPGNSFALVGTSGSGKSTTLSLLQLFYHPSSGSILLDGHDVRNLQLKWLRKQMGLVSQEPALFAGTIADNIIHGKEDADMDQVIEAAKIANAHSFIQSLPDGYHTQVGEGGTQLSGGQKQRVAIARALIRNPKILLLDEATSALDADSELAVQKALDEVVLHRTTIIIAHRLSTIQDVDQILVLSDGRVVESGTHVELMSKGGEYASLVGAQVSDYGNNPSVTTSGALSMSESFINNVESSSTTAQGLRTTTSKTRQESMGQPPSLKELAMMNKEELPYAVLGCIGASLAGIQAPLTAFGLTYMLTTFYYADHNKIRHDVRIVSFLFLAFAIVTVPIYLLQHYFFTLMGERVTTRVRRALFAAMLSNEAGWFELEENNTGLLTSKLAIDATLVRAALVDRLSVLVNNVALIVAAFVMAFSMSWRVSAVTVATYPLVIANAIAEQYFMKGLGLDYSRAYSRATSLAREAIANIRIVAAFGIEEQISKQFCLLLEKPSREAFLRGHIAGSCFGMLQLLAFWSYALSLWYGSVLVRDGKNKFQDIIRTFFILMITAFVASETVSIAPQILKGLDALGSVFAILKRKPSIDPNDPKSLVLTDIKGHIKFNDVSFKYPARPDALVLQNLNLEVPSGKSLAIVGKSGSGKSTVVKLIMRFYDPNSGSIMIDGHDLRTLNLKSLRGRISLVQQEPTLFSTTIYDNIRYGNEGATEIEIVAAAKAANAHEFITKMPDGYKTLVGKQGSQLSGGQKQRVAIARAILKDPAILLLDEATSALDSLSEKVVQEALDVVMQGRTTVVVAHRFSTVRDANGIVVMHQGKVAERGTHNELISNPGSLYAQLVSIQHEKIVSIQQAK